MYNYSYTFLYKQYFVQLLQMLIAIKSIFKRIKFMWLAFSFAELYTVHSPSSSYRSYFHMLRHLRRLTSSKKELLINRACYRQCLETWPRYNCRCQGGCNNKIATQSYKGRIIHSSYYITITIIRNCINIIIKSYNMLVGNTQSSVKSYPNNHLNIRDTCPSAYHVNVLQIDANGGHTSSTSSALSF